MLMPPGRSYSEADHLILDAATADTRRLTGEEVTTIRQHVAGAGFRPEPSALAGGRLEGVVWRDRLIKRTDYLSAAEVHYLRHCVLRQEWPVGTSLGDYVLSVAGIVRDSASGLLVSRWQDRVWHLSVVRRSEPWRGPDGFDWTLVEYDVDAGRWVSAFQLAHGLPGLTNDRRRSQQRWLQLPSLAEGLS